MRLFCWQPLKGKRPLYHCILGIDGPQLEAVLHQCRQTLDPEGRKKISADIQRRLADQIE